jgi:hypothetical protein
VLDVVDDTLLDAPASPFLALHAALALAAAGDLGRLGRLAARCRDADQAPSRDVVAPLCDALVAAGEEHWFDAVDGLEAALARLVTVGGSAAQREVVEETLVLALVRSGDTDRAAALVQARLDRRPSPLDARRRAVLADPAPGAPGGRSGGRGLVVHR